MVTFLLKIGKDRDQNGPHSRIPPSRLRSTIIPQDFQVGLRVQPKAEPKLWKDPQCLIGKPSISMGHGLTMANC
jgi:hypothetical protein